MIWTSNVVRFARAIAKAEGFGMVGAIPTVANNPGDLTFADGFPTAGFANKEGVLRFLHLEDGWTALYHQCDLMLRGKSKVYGLNDTLAQVALKYAHDPNWGLNVAKSLNVPVTTTLKQISQLPEEIEAT